MLQKEEILKLAKLSRLSLTENEITQYQKELNAILDYFKRLESVDVAGLDPTYQVNGLINVMRKDEPINYTAKPEDLLRAAPKTNQNYIEVRRML